MTEEVRARGELQRAWARSIMGAAPEYGGLYRYVAFELIPDYLADGWMIIARASAHSVIMRSQLP